MTKAENKVKFGLSNVYYSVITETQTAGGVTEISYGVPTRLPGGVSISLQAQGDQVLFPADDITYWASYANNGYQGSLEVARITDDFREDVLNETSDTNGVLLENSNNQPKAFALMFEFQGDSQHTRHVLYNCVCSRPDVAGETIGGDKTLEPQTETLNLTVSPRVTDGIVKARCDENSAAYTNWYTAVYTGTAQQDDNDDQDDQG